MGPPSGLQGCREALPVALGELGEAHHRRHVEPLPARVSLGPRGWRHGACHAPLARLEAPHAAGA
eukprot:4973469-Pyramimonas_sp.AAC.1